MRCKRYAVFPDHVRLLYAVEIQNDTQHKTIRTALAGMPGPLTLWLSHVMKTMLWTLGPARGREIWPLDNETVLRGVSGETDVPAFIFTDVLTSTLSKAILDHATLVLIVVEDPQTLVQFLHDRSQSSYVESVRRVSGSLAQLSALTAHKGAVILPPNAGRLKAGDVLSHLSRLAFGEDISFFSDALKGIGINFETSIEDQFHLFASTPVRSDVMTDVQVEEIDAICKGAYKYLFKRECFDVVWPISFFIQGELFVAPPPRLINLLGPARCLYFGPYLSLPAGHWSGEIIFGLSQDIEETHVRVHVMQSDIIADFESTARKGGLYSLAFKFHLKDPNQPVEVRLMLDRGEIEGKIAFGQVKISLNPPDEASCFNSN